MNNIYCTLTFHSNKEKFDLSIFESKIQLYRKTSWSIGDLQHPNYQDSARLDSTAVIKSETSKDHDGKEIISSFFHYLYSKKEGILELKNQYNATLYFDLIVNQDSSDSPVIFLDPNHLTLLSELDASMNVSIYDYR
ncbi:DUF4279 domain-containing protein [Sutcliffiella horikoshii]|uniref:DUF4279 domain-containing protein n=1 Tax=Sutcliffiella horikoshii TaxID=79883 RepID=A0A5D4SWX8_9BACI|nr:DUF4279 domain-containing protein [Sutcliffiella horikoshii]TYS67479.1 DUF4279 domain-containing protein [Sutcliffiella horikoshii]